VRAEKISQIKRWIGVTLILTIVIGLGLWELDKPKLTVANKAQLSQAIQNSSQADSKSIFRMVRLIALSHSLRNLAAGLPVRSVSVGIITTQTPSKVWSARRVELELLQTILLEGPVRYRPLNAGAIEVTDAQSLKYLVRSLCQLTASAAFLKDYKTCDQSVRLLMLLSKRLLDAGGGYSEYQISTTVWNSVETTIADLGRRSDCPEQLIQFVLTQLTSPKGDPWLEKAITTEYQEYIVPRLAQPSLFMKDLIHHGMGIQDFDSYFEPSPEDYSGLGTFDPDVAIPEINHIYNIESTNAMRPLSQEDKSVNKLTSVLQHQLPRSRGRKGTFERTQFRFVMNNMPNSIGKALTVRFGGQEAQDLLIQSHHWRAINQCNRVLLATRLYRLAHHGDLPLTLAELVPQYLPKIPEDPYNAKLLHYDTGRQRVWSVGDNLIDDGGKFDGRVSINKDIGVLLELHKPEDPTVSMPILRQLQGVR